ncbi:TPA: hypothetical protein ACH3X2_006497 [Trebouxia sp. C0005]
MSLQKLLQKRTGRAAQRPPKEPRQSYGSKHQQQHEADLLARPPVHAPPPDVAVASSAASGVGNARLDPDQVSMHLDALGWEQATKGDTATSEYWQFAPRETTLDLTSFAAQQGNDDEAVSPGLRTPSSAHERRRASTQRLARDSHPSTINGSPGPSPANSFQLQQQPVLPLSQPHTDLALPLDSRHLRRLTSTTQQQVQIIPHACSSQPPASRPELNAVGHDDIQSSSSESQAVGKLPTTNSTLHHHLKDWPQDDAKQFSSSPQLQHSAAAPQPKSESMLYGRDDNIQLRQASGDIKEQRSRQGLAEPQAIMLAASPGHQSTPFAPVVQQSQQHQQQPPPQQQQQQQDSVRRIPFSSSLSQEPFRQDSAATTPAVLHTATGLVSEPPSASWQYTEAAASTPTAQQGATYFSSPTSNSIMPGKMNVQQQLPQASADEQGGTDTSSATPGRLGSSLLQPTGRVSAEAAQLDALSTLHAMEPFQHVVPTPGHSLSRQASTDSQFPPQPAWSPVRSPTKADSDWQPPLSPRRPASSHQPPPSANQPAPDRPSSTSLTRKHAAAISRGPAASFTRAASYPLARSPSTASLGSTLGSPHYTCYGISPNPPTQSTPPPYIGRSSMDHAPSQLQTHQLADSAPPDSPQVEAVPGGPLQPNSLPSLGPVPHQQQAAQPGRATSSKVRAGQGRSPGQAALNTTSASMSLPAGAAQQQGGNGEAVSRAGPSNGEAVPGAGLGTRLLPDSSMLNSMGHRSVAPESEVRSASRASPPAASTATTWLHSHSAHQLSINVRNLAAQVVTARSKQAQELAILKLYAVLSQAHFVKQQAAEWEGAFLGILSLGFPLLLKHTAEVVIQQDRGYSNMVRGMAAAIVKSIARWMEGQLDEAGPCQALVQQVLTQLVQEANPGGARYAGAQGPTIHENEAWDSIMPTHQSLMATEVTGMGGLLDSGTLDGMLDTDVTSIVHPSRPDHRQPRWGVMETAGLVGSSSAVDSQAWQEVMQHRMPTSTTRPPSILETGATYMVLDTQDVAEYARSHARGLRLTFWLFKTDQEDAWYAASSLVGSMASLGEAHIDGMGGMKLVKPLFLVLRRGGNQCKAAALRALQHLTTERACRAMTARQDSYLQALVRAVQQADTGLQYPAIIILARLITHDPSTHYIVAQAGLIQALAKVLKQGGMSGEVREGLSEALKHLTASSQKNRDTLVASQALPIIIAHLRTGEEAVQYNTARTLRHLALGSQPAHKIAALPAVVPLTQALQVGGARVQFACASALAMLVEGHGEVCPLVLRHGGLASLATMLRTAGAQGKKAAAEALQALAAEDVDMKPRVAKSGAIQPLVTMVKTGNLQQQAAAAGALQALAYCPGTLDISAGIASEGGVAPLVTMVTTGPLPLRSAAAGALCNLALASPHNQAAIIKAGAVPALVQLLEIAQPDGQYAAAAALYNLAGQDAQVRLSMTACKAVPPLVLMLQADSWYCRIVAAEVLGRLSMEWSNREHIQQAGAVIPLLQLLRLKHSPGMLDSVEGPVHHLAYERGEDVIVMKGYKFAKAKTAATATLGCLALANSAVATQLVQAGVAEHLMVMLESSSAEVRSVAAACLGDLAAAHPPLQLYLAQRISKLMRLLLCNFKQAGSVNRPDVAAAGAAIGLLVAQQSAARVGLLQLGGLKPLLAMLHQGTLAEQSVSANVLFDMSQGSEEAARLIQAQGVTERVHSLVASTDTPAAAAGGGTAALLQNTALLDYAGFAVTAKPSVNLLVLLQIPFEELGGKRQPHSLVPADLLLTTVQSLGPAPSLAPLSLHNHDIHSGGSTSDDSEQEELDSPLLQLHPIYPQSGQSHAFAPAADKSVQPSRVGHTSSQPPFSSSHRSQSSVSDLRGRQGAGQEQWTHPVAGQFRQQSSQQHILDTYVG